MQSNLLGLTRWTTFLLAGLVLVFTFAACSDDESDDIPVDPTVDTDLLIERGWDHLNGGDVDDAIESFSNAVSGDATSLDAYLGLGYALGYDNQGGVGMQNLSNIIALKEVLTFDAEDSTDLRKITAETYIGMALISLAEEEYEDAVEYAQEATEYWNEQSVHRKITTFSWQDLRILEAKAHVGMASYDRAMRLVEEFDNTFVGTANHVIADTDTLILSAQGITSDSRFTGSADLIMPNGYTIEVLSIVDTQSRPQYIDSWVMGGNTVTFLANPLPVAGSIYYVDYLYADDFGKFLIALHAKIEELSD